MITRDFVEEDQQLQRFAATPQDRKPRFNWADVAQAAHHAPAESRLFVQVGDQRRQFDAGEIADTVGNAVTDLALSRNQEDIFNEENRQLVAGIAESVRRELLAECGEDGEPRVLSEDQIAAIIERVLIRNNAHDVAKSLVIRRKTAPVRKPGDPKGVGAGATDRSGKPLCKVIRRSGEVVAWNPNKIEVAVRSAFLSLGMDSGPASDVSRAMTDQIARGGQEYIHIEDLQDRVQEELMKQGHYKVAAAYIIYRDHRAGQRKSERRHSDLDEDSAQESMILVKTADGDSYLWDGLDLRRRIDFGMIGLDLCLTADEIEHELRRAFFSEMTVGDLKKTVILNAKSLIERDGDFAVFAGRILLTYIYEEVLGWDIVRDGIAALPLFHRRAFKANLLRGIQIERLSDRLTRFNLDKLAQAIDPVADLDFDYLGIQTLYDRYLIVDKTAGRHQRIETPQLFWMRVAMGLFIDEQENPEDLVISLYNLYKSRRFCSSTPTLFNSGTPHSQLSSCYLYKVDDSIESIMLRGIAENAFLSKWAGGLGGSWTAVRGTGGYIKGTNGESQGVIPFLKMHNDQLVAVNQGGKRRGSGCAYLETWHNDIADFLELRRNTGDERRRAHDMNTANWIPDLFMKR
ncbi:MAG: ribonucleoside-diphosphate reductase subunit alpha, partial [Verrucomicrobiae bacterium]|nr:ribonucleoside-diphosphate reductase subunit alpha [Verrucomicrobiae bacterium]